MAILWSADGTEGVCVPTLPYRHKLCIRNATKGVCHISIAGPIFPFEVVRLEDFRPPCLLSIQSWLCLQKGVGAMIYYQGKLRPFKVTAPRLNSSH